MRFPLVLLALLAPLLATFSMLSDNVAAADAAGAPEAQPKNTRIVIIGDSTVCNYPPESPARGWGQFIAEYFRPEVQVINLAMSGRSTKTFIQEGRWTAALEAKPDYVLIQFGHNDSHASDRPEATDAATNYREYLRRYVDEARAAGAEPILITPMHRRTFNAEGKLEDILQPYAEAMKAVAAEKHAPLIDLHTSSGKLFQSLGDPAAQEFANKPTDRTHFNEKGARAMAALVMQELPKVEPRLRPLLRAEATPIELGTQSEAIRQPK